MYFDPSCPFPPSHVHLHHLLPGLRRASGFLCFHLCSPAQNYLSRLEFVVCLLKPLHDHIAHCVKSRLISLASWAIHSLFPPAFPAQHLWRPLGTFNSCVLRKPWVPMLHTGTSAFSAIPVLFYWRQQKFNRQENVYHYSWEKKNTNWGYFPVDLIVSLYIKVIVPVD